MRNWTEDLSYWLNAGPDLCLSALADAKHSELNAAIVCGISLQPNATRQLFLDTGLIHILVVSGAHLAFLDEWVLSRLRPSIRLALLAAYAWLTGFGPPVVRAWLRRALETRCRALGYSPLQMEALTICLLLVLVPSWISSRSLMMSWLCALALSLPTWTRWKTTESAFKIYVLLWPFCAAHPISVFWNVTLAPVMGVALFPIALISAWNPLSSFVLDPLWILLLGVLRLNPELTAPMQPLATAGWIWLPLLLNASFILGEISWRRARAFSSASSFGASR